MLLVKTLTHPSPYNFSRNWARSASRSLRITSATACVFCLTPLYVVVLLLTHYILWLLCAYVRPLDVGTCVAKLNTFNMKIRFTVAEKAVMERDGASFSLDKYREGVDYVVRKCFSSSKRMFRADILGLSEVDPSYVEHKQDIKPIKCDLSEVKCEQKLVKSQDVNISPEDWRASVPVVEHKVVKSETKVEVQECKIVRIYPNFKWVDTDKGRVWVGLKGSQMKRGQVIRVKGGELFLGKTGPSGSLVKL